MSTPAEPALVKGGESSVPYYVKALSLGIPAYLIGVHLWTWAFMFQVFIGGRADFRQLYTAGYMVRAGHAEQLYDYQAQLRWQNELVSKEEVRFRSSGLPMRPSCSSPYLSWATEAPT